MVSIRDMRDFGLFLIRPEDSRVQEDRCRFCNHSLHSLVGRCRKTAKRLSQTRMAGICKALVWMATAVAIGCGLGQLN